MYYSERPSVQVGAWTRVDDDVEIKYLVLPDEDSVEFTLGSDGELEMTTSEAGLRRCLAAFAHALEDLEAAAASRPDSSAVAEFDSRAVS